MSLLAPPVGIDQWTGSLSMHSNLFKIDHCKHLISFIYCLSHPATLSAGSSILIPSVVAQYVLLTYLEYVETYVHVSRKLLKSEFCILWGLLLCNLGAL